MSARVKPHSRFPGVYQVTLEDGCQRFGTVNLAPGRSVYGERLVRFRGVEYRVWDAFRSKLAAAMCRDIQTMPIKPGHSVLYLGAASGTTASHVSDIVGGDGHVYCVEFASRSLKDLVYNVCSFRFNMSPILEDARYPERYAKLIRGKVDDVYCDIAQPDQAKILVDNADLLLKESGWIMLAIKAQSIDVTKEPTVVYKSEMKVLQKRGLSVKEVVRLEPYEKAHAMVVAQK